MKRRLAAPLVITFAAACSSEAGPYQPQWSVNPPCFGGSCPDTLPRDTSRSDAGTDVADASEPDDASLETDSSVADSIATDVPDAD